MKKLNSIKSFVKSHKISSIVIAIIVIALGYYIYTKSTSTSGTPQYVVNRARLGAITQTVSGTGQVSSVNQLAVKSQVSGTIDSINVAVGDHVTKGQLLAVIDHSSADLDLANAKISLQKLTEPAKAGDLVNAQNNLNKAYNDAFNAVANLYIDLPSVMNGLRDFYYSSSGFLAEQKISNLNPTSRAMRSNAGISLDQALSRYQTALLEYKSLTRSSATSSLDAMFTDTKDMANAVSETIKNTQNIVTYIVTLETDYYAKDSTTASANVTSWSNTINNDLSSLVSAMNSIDSNGNTLNNLVTGNDPLDIQQARISLAQKEQTYANYFIRAPFDGIVGRIPVNVYDEASGGTEIATIIGSQKVATISLNEVDASKVSVGQKVSITFDAIDGLTVDGSVSEVDLVGTVSQGVVSYNVEIAINSEDQRIKPGMSVNTTITTNEKTGVIVVPSSAVKTQGKTSYVQVLASIPQTNTTGIMSQNGTGTRFARFASSTASTTSNMPSYSGGTTSSSGRTITSSTAPNNVTVTTGLTDDTNTEITSGLTGGEWVVTRTITSSASSQSAPSILSSFGGNRTTGNAVRATTGR